MSSPTSYKHILLVRKLGTVSKYYCALASKCYQ